MRRKRHSTRRPVHLRCGDNRAIGQPLDRSNKGTIVKSSFTASLIVGSIPQAPDLPIGCRHAGHQPFEENNAWRPLVDPRLAAVPPGGSIGSRRMCIRQINPAVKGLPFPEICAVHPCLELAPCLPGKNGPSSGVLRAQSTLIRSLQPFCWSEPERGEPPS